MNRRSAIKKLVYGALMLPLCRIEAQAASPPLSPDACSGRLSFYNTHTRESLAVNYLNPDGSFNHKALSQLNHHFRCHYKGEKRPIDPEVFLLLDAVHKRLGAGNRPFHLVSGFRSPEYNQWLRKRRRDVAKNSYHILGRAADVRIMGIKLEKICKAAKSFQVGGVGTYSTFIHVDTGPIRSWG